MIITRTPFRVSFFGGGTDYPAWYREHGGAVLATAIDKYCYITCRSLPPFFSHRHRIVYSKIENVCRTDEIQHPAVRAVFEWLRVQNGLEIHHDGDLPARSGLGSSSAFICGLLQAIKGLRGEMISQERLAQLAIHIEQEVIGDNVGSQDQISAAVGGFNRIHFHQDNSFEVEPVLLSSDRLRLLNKHLMLCFTGLSRTASEVAKSKIQNLSKRATELNRMRCMVDEAVDILSDARTPITDFGRLLDEAWQYKRRLSDQVSNAEIDGYYEAAIKAGAIGGKILGAGGGGFMLLFAEPDKHAYIRSKLNSLVHVPFEFDKEGSRVVLYQPDGLMARCEADHELGAFESDNARRFSHASATTQGEAASVA